MGKKDWCSKKGWKAREKGMKEQESQKRKICYTVLFGLCALFCLAIGAVQLAHWTNAEAINSDYNDPRVDNSYDACAYPSGYITEPDKVDDATAAALTLGLECGFDASCYRAGTTWTDVWGANGIIMLFMAFNFVLMSVGGFYFYPRCIGTWINAFCACCCHSTVVGLALSGRWRAYGNYCSFNIMPSQYDGNYLPVVDGYSYADEAGLIGAFGVLQMLLCFAQCCCFCLPLRNTPVVGKDKDKEIQPNTMVMQQMQMQQMQQPASQAL